MPRPHFREISSQFPLLLYGLAGRHRHLVEQRVELRPYVIAFRTSNVAVSAFLDRPNTGGGRLGFIVMEVVIAPAVGCLISLGVLDSHIRAVEGAREESFPRWRGSRTVRMSGGLHELQFFHEDCSFGEDARFLVDVVGTRLDIYVMKFREVCLRGV